LTSKFAKSTNKIKKIIFKNAKIIFPSENCITKDEKSLYKYRNIIPATPCLKSLPVPGRRPFTFPHAGKVF
jgi:hypothetical protein